ncbi:Uncharacterised protein [Vibrio cholerae]|uniref:Uncharacterized protein n=1 Tax=Vibrio cholerae TaxID=666 RepID=A0A655QWY7_VIBCL|nr:Uncharacterised protein [Vibrio cholerae]CSA74958.1 Uncharacterised protein [Vibrio cholerae]CSD27580.1 Uncharacterised protein [Vibrio cholerae]
MATTRRVTAEFGIGGGFDQRIIVRTKLAGLTSALTLLFHRLFKTRFINAKATLTRHIIG